MGEKLRIASDNCRWEKHNAGVVKALCEESDLIFLEETMLIGFDNAFLEGLSGDSVYFAVNAMKARDGPLRGRPRGELAILYRKAYSHLISFSFPSDERLQPVCVSCNDQE